MRYQFIHDNRGSQYAGAVFQKVLKHNGMRLSMSRKGNCWDNAPMESFFHSLKVELIGGRFFRTREDARREIFAYIVIWYNRKRLHSALGNVSPVEYERLLQVA